MTKKKKLEEDVETSDSNGKINEEETVILEKTPEEIITKLEEEIKELKHNLLKEKADLENTKKRLERERIIERKYVALSISKNLLPALDSFDLALMHKVTDEESEKIFQGFKMIKEQLVKALEEEGVSEIDALDEEYDPNFHQAIITEKVENKEPNIVIEVIQKGYIFKDRLIRPAIVKISE